MSNGDDESAEDAAAAGEGEAEGEAAAVEGAAFEDLLEAAEGAVETAGGDEAGAKEFEATFDAIGDALDGAETEDDLDAVEELLDEAEAALENASLPEPDEDDEDADDPRADLEERLEALRADLEDARGPYAEDVTTAIGEAASTLEEADWTEDGEEEALEAAVAFLNSVDEVLDTAVSADGEDIDAALEALDAAGDAVADADLDPDADAETIADLLEATDALASDLEAAEEWSDLTTREQLDAHGFYDVLEHHKDYPPEWSALKVWEKRGRADMVLLALDTLGMEFMEEHCLSALRRMGPEEAIEPMLDRAERRDRPAIEVLGKIGDDAALETLLEYVDVDSDPQLQKVTLRALGEIGSEEATQAVADQLESENPRIRSRAARSLGLIGDPRAIEPLADVLENGEAGQVRASAAWALLQIGTRDALDVLVGYTDDREYLVEAEARKADEALSATA